ncbi:hypothetical protein B0H13DRAFT_1890740 [Mycena leptocephala]|nr:hypothetical protein B0H13DRAFT_1890740 [Mycena leptocephala]
MAAELKYLQEASNTFTPFVGTVDLARFAKDHLAMTSAKIGLADLSTQILGKRLNKDISEQISTAWEWEQLSESQLRYAALDGYTCSCLDDSLTHIPIPSLLPLLPSIGISVLLFNADLTRVIARDKISALEGSYNDINITSTRCRVDISEVVVPPWFPLP